MRTAKVLYYLLHPLLMPLLGVALILNLELNTEFWTRIEDFIYRLVLLCTLVLPITLFFSLFVLKLINEVAIERASERKIYLAFTAFCYYLGHFLMGRFLTDPIITRYPALNLISIFLLACVFVCLALLSISFFWELSPHMASSGGIVGLLFFINLVLSVDLTLYISLAFLISGIAGSLLIILRDQKLIQLLTGWFLGFLVVTVSLFVFHS
ncbi:MAG: hypothetical protein JW801_08340 [Bacteroidales bacterium]|nr:hypothetical protein [Bacteroidales bacterium]